jgi:hypothetical protein
MAEFRLVLLGNQQKGLVEVVALLALPRVYLMKYHILQALGYGLVFAMRSLLETQNRYCSVNGGQVRML